MSEKNGLYNIEPRTCVLVLEEFAGAEVRCRLDVGTNVWLAIFRLSNSQDPDLIDEAYRCFGDVVLKEWNIVLEGESLPATGEGFLRMPPAIGGAMIQAWLATMTEIPAPLGEGSPSSQGDSPEPTTTKAEVS